MTTGLDPLPSPTASSLLPPHHDSTSLLPLPPPPTGSTPTKRRSKVPNTDRRNTDIEFATEIGQGLLLEVRKMQALLQEKEEKLRTLENQKADLERAAEAMAKQMRQREENEEKLKEETWNLELAKQELTISVTELQQNLNKANVEQNKLAKQVNELRAEIEQLRDREEKLNQTIETMKNRHEQDMSAIRRHAAALQREKSDQTKQIETLTSELAIAKAQSRIAKHVISEAEPSTRSEQSDDQNLSTPTVKNDTSPASSPPPSPKQLPTSRSQAMEVETLKTSLAHAHRMVSNLRSNLHKEKTEKFELKKLLAESQETIEQLQNDPRLWVDARPVRSSSSHLGSKDDSRRPHKASTSSTKRRGRKTGDSASRRGKFKNASSRHADNDSVYSYSSMSDNSGDDSASESDAPASPFENAPSVGFTTLSSELSQSQMTQKPVAVDAEVNTDPVHIESVPPSLDDKLDKPSSETSPIKQLAGGLVAGAAAAVGSLLPTKSGVDISIQTEPKPEGVDCLVQTHAVPTASLSTQTDDSSSLDEPKVVVDASIQTETEPKAVGIEISIQTDDVSTSKSAVEVLVQTEEEEKPKGIEESVQTMPTPTASLSTQTEDSQVVEVSTQTEIEAHEMLTQTETKDSVDSSVQHHVESTDAETQTRMIETRDAQVQYDTDMFQRPPILPLPLSASPSTYRPFSDDEDNDSFYYDAASDIAQSKPSSRNTLSSLAGLNEPGSRRNLKMTEDSIHKKPLTPHMSRADSMFGSKPTSIHTLMEGKPTENETRVYDKDGAESKLFTKEEADAMIAAAVAAALSKANDDKNASRRDSALVSSAEKPDDIEEQEEEDNGFGNVAIQVPREVIATSIQTVEKERALPDLADGPSIVFDQEPEEQVWSENNIPQRPSNPPPAALLNRAVSPNRLSKGKMPETESEPQQSLHRGAASMSSLSTANTNEQLHSIASSHFDNRSTNATDPLMISLITKTMIGDWLWKYTRNAMGGGISEKRHQRYFWIHPYTRTLYWSNKAPGVDGTETKAKSALIENITVVPDYSTTPSGLPNVSLLIQTSHRQLKLTAPTLEKHDTWFESISHLLVRNNESSSGSVGDNRPNNTNNVKSVSSGASGSILERPSFRRLHDMFYQPSTSTATATYGTDNTANDDYEDEPLEDVRMCCNGKHHVSKLEREHNHRQYRKRTSRIPNQQH
ncbi:hypothetical protein RMCBS344292_05075 [Rhizopus microsporus]|nr:hypothetical protein RMCBS344292_05075 [Rhizopus microsporus]